MNQSNALHGEEPNDPPIEWKSQPPAAYFKSRTSPPKTSPVFSDIMGRLNNHAIDNADVEFHPSEFLVEYNYEYVPYPDTNPIKSIDDYEMDYIPEFFHLEHNCDFMDVDLQMLQDWLVVSPH